MARMRLLDLALPFSLVVPEVEFPYQKIPVLERAAYTLGSGLIFLLLTEVSLTGIDSAVSSADPIAWLRAPLAASHGTPAELGVVPVVLSGMIFQILAGFRKLNVSLDLRSDRALFQSLQKSTALLISLVFALVLAFSRGTFGADHLVASTRQQLTVAVEIFGGSAVTIYLDEILSKGYGFAPGTVLFTLIATSQRFIWSLLSLESVSVGGKHGTSTYGVFPSIFFNLNSRSFSYTFTNTLFGREGLPTLLDVAAGAVVFLGVMYLSMYRFNLQIRSTKMRAQSSSFPIRLIYTGSQPLLLAASVLSVFLTLSYALNNLCGPTCWLVKLLGVWNPVNATPISGIAALLVPTWQGNAHLIYKVLRTVIHPVLLAVACGWIGAAWTNGSGAAPHDIAKMFKENSIVLVGKRETSAVKELKKVIPLAAALGGGILGAVAGTADAFAPAGWGIAMGVAAMNLLSVFEGLAEDGVLNEKFSL